VNDGVLGDEGEVLEAGRKQDLGEEQRFRLATAPERIKPQHETTASIEGGKNLSSRARAKNELRPVPVTARVLAYSETRFTRVTWVPSEASSRLHFTYCTP